MSITFLGFICFIIIFLTFLTKKDVKDLYLVDDNVLKIEPNSKIESEFFEQQKDKVFSDLEELKKYILSLNDSIFKGKSYGLSQRDDGNISFKLSDRNKPKDSVGVFIDFNLFKKNDLTKNIKSNSLKLNFVINNKDIYDKLKKRSISISDYPEIRNTYIKTPLKTFQGEVFIENINELERILNICNN